MADLQGADAGSGAASPRAAAPIGPGDGTGDGLPGGGGPVTGGVQCTITAPAKDSYVTGPEPGVAFTVQGTALGWVKSPDGSSSNPVPDVSVEVDGQFYAATVAADGSWAAQCRVYHRGTLTVSATATIWSGHFSAANTATTEIQAWVDATNPTMSATAPGAGFQIDLTETGANVAVAVSMADAGQFGNHAVTVTSDSGHQTTLTPVPGSATQFTGTVLFDPMPLGPRTLTVTGACAAVTSLSTATTITGAGVDVAAPDEIRVTTPEVWAGQVQVAGTAPNFTVTIIGTARDAQSGMAGGKAAVTVALSPQATPDQQIAARPARTPGDFSDWTVDIPVPAPPAPGTAPPSLGTFWFYIWATDAAGITTSQPTAWSFEAVNVWQPLKLEERLGPVEYLQDLISFAGQNVGTVIPGQPPQYDSDGNMIDPGTPDTFGGVTVQDLDTILGQPLTGISLTPPAAAVQAPVNELRVPIEVLRVYMATPGAQIPASPGGQNDYLWAAYQMLLAGIGTTFTELREARAAKDAARQALADRLGVPLYQLSASPIPASTPQARFDQLDAITLSPATPSTAGTITETALQDLFGLTATTPFDPAQPPPDPTASRWYRWRREAQRALWLREDQQPPNPVAYRAIVDPDVITPADLMAGAQQHDQLLALLQQRTQQLAAQESTLTTARTAHAADADGGLQTLLAAASLGVDLAALQASDQQGIDISPQLAAAGLDRAGFTYLLQIRALATAAASMITDAEWDDAIAVLAGAYRRGQYSQWQQQEQAAQPAVVLSPDAFTAGEDPPIRPLRIDPQARRDWLTTLRARSLQRQDLDDATGNLLAGTEQAALPGLRDALLAGIAAAPGATSPGQDPITAAGEQIITRYHTDPLRAGTLTTTRVEQATTSLQTFLQAARAGTTGYILNTYMNRDAAGLFDRDWQWMATFEGWQAATTTFLFPEAALDPTQLTAGPTASKAPTSAYNQIRDDLFGNGVDVTAAVDSYLTAMVGDRAHNFGLLGSPYSTLSYDPPVSETLSQALSQTDPGLAAEVFWAVPMLIAHRLQADRRYPEALGYFASLYGGALFDRITVELTNNPPPPDLTLDLSPGFSAHLDPFTLVNPPSHQRPYPYLRATLLAAITCLLEWADAEFTAETDETIAHAHDLYRAALALLNHPRFVPVKPSDPRNAALPIPQWTALQTRAANQLTKIRQDRNIAGLPRSQPLAGAGIQQPTPYHFKVLLSRAQQFTQQATTLEAEYLAALEKFAQQTLAEFDAQNAAALAAAQLTVHDAQFQLARDGLTAAQAQQTKAVGTVSTLTQAIAAPPNIYEQQLFDDYDDARGAQDVIAAGDLMVGLGQASATLGSTSNPFTHGWIAAGAILEAAGAATKFGGQLWLSEVQRSTQRSQLNASIEDRRQQWRIQLASAQQDVLVAAAQVTTARDQVDVAAEERVIAGMQLDQARARLALLLSQFTSAALYKWLADTLGGVYRFFLQQATATARLAQAQLAFERAEPPRAFIRADYWDPPTTPAVGSGGDVRGLTGAERLAEDVAKLDQYAFGTDTRRLNLSQTFSLAQLAPTEFLDFKRTGQMSFATPMDLFDRDFPGHYQRLIRQARLTVVALIPPSRGIRATLRSNGISRVITANNSVFSPVVLRRDPTLIGLTSPVDASGVFAIDLQPDMLLPFEGSGVDTTWELSLPAAANPFDFRTISDVLLTIDYTALADGDYQTQVIRQLNASPQLRGDLILSLASDFPDAWYALSNPDPTQPAGQRGVTVSIQPSDLPANLDPASLPLTTAVAIRLGGAQPPPPAQVTLSRGILTGSAVTDSGGIASSRRAAAAWQVFTADPRGDWTLTFEATPDQTAAGYDPIPALFGPGGLTDIILIVSWTGTVTAWTP